MTEEEMYMIRKRPRKIKHAELFGKYRLPYGPFAISEAILNEEEIEDK